MMSPLDVVYLGVLILIGVGAWEFGYRHGYGTGYDDGAHDEQVIHEAVSEHPQNLS